MAHALWCPGPSTSTTRPTRWRGAIPPVRPRPAGRPSPHTWPVSGRPRWCWWGRHPGQHGARWTGVPFTSPHLLTGSGPREPTATVVHRVLAELGWCALTSCCGTPRCSSLRATAIPAGSSSRPVPRAGAGVPRPVGGGRGPIRRASHGGPLRAPPLPRRCHPVRRGPAPPAARWPVTGLGVDRRSRGGPVIEQVIGSVEGPPSGRATPEGSTGCSTTRWSSTRRSSSRRSGARRSPPSTSRPPPRPSPATTGRVLDRGARRRRLPLHQDGDVRGHRRARVRDHHGREVRQRRGHHPLQRPRVGSSSSG